MKKFRFLALVCLLLVMTMLVTACGKKKDKGNGDDGCSHESTSVVDKKDATCTVDGYTGDTVCDNCGETVEEGQTIAATGKHSLGAESVTVTPTCTTAGEAVKKCSKCDYTEKTTIPPQHNNTYHDSHDGENHTLVCIICTVSGNEKHQATGSGSYVAATCTSAAYTEYTCALCGGAYRIYSTTEPALGHDLGAWEITKDSTCSAAGRKSQSCQRDGCDFSNRVTVPASGRHFYVFDGYESIPNCCQDGSARFVCDGGCGEVEYRPIAANGIHTYVELESTGDGWCRKQCVYCYDVISSFDASTLVSAELNTDDIDTTTSLEMNMQSAAIQFPQNVVGQIASGSDLSISAGELDQGAKESALDKIEDEEQKAILEGAPIYDFTVTVDGNTFSDTFNEKVAITVPYSAEDVDADGIVIYYLADNGDIETITDVVYDPEAQTVTFFVEHFSYYAVAYAETQAMKCKRGNHNFVATNVREEATCYSFGYTLYECTGCYKTTIDDIADRREHNYGELIGAKPSCEWGDYSTKKCQNPGCGDILQVQYFAALGHEMDHAASCDTSSSCTKCGKVLSRPLGHSWSEWKTTVAPTPVSNGLKTRTCSTCNTTDEVTIAATGAIDSIAYDSYIELLNALLGDIVGLSSGTLEYSYMMNQYGEAMEVSSTVSVEKTSDGYRMHLIAKNKELGKDGIEVLDFETVEFYYDNGTFVAKSPDDDYYGSSLNAIVPLPIDVFKEVATEVYEQLDNYVYNYLDMTESMLDSYVELAGSEINTVLASAGISYTVEELYDIIDSIKTVYAYLSIRLGYEPSIELGDNITLPTANDLKEVLSLFMASSKVGDVTTYTLTSAPMIDTLDALLDFAEEHIDDTYAEFIYAVLEKKIKEYDASITSFNALVDHIATKLPGSFTVSDAIDKYIELSEESDLPALEDVYALINKVAEAYYGEEFDCEAFVDENAALTLDDLAKMMSGVEDATMADIYAGLKEYAADNYVGEIVVDEYYEYPDYGYGENGKYPGGILIMPEPTPIITYVTLKDVCKEARTYFDAIDFEGGISISIDDAGRIVGLTVDEDLWIDTTFSGEFSKVSDFHLAVTHDSAVQVTIPAEISSLMNKVTYTTDASGNVIVSGLASDAEYNFSVYGNGTVDFSDALEKDTALSIEYGFDVYVLKPAYWNDRNYLDGYYLIDGKYYESDAMGSIIFAEANTAIDQASFISGISKYVTVDKDRNMGYLESYDGVKVYPIVLEGARSVDSGYSSTIGIAYEIDGVWYATTDYGQVSNPYADDTYYYAYNAKTLDAFYSGVQIGSVMDIENRFNSTYYRNAYILADGEYAEALVINIELGANQKAISFLAYAKNGTHYVLTDWDGWSHEMLYIEAPSVSLPTHDYSYDYTTTVYTIDASGNITKRSCKGTNLYVKVPTYYVEVTDGKYVRLDSEAINVSFDKSGFDAVELPDGNTLYKLGTTYDNEYGYEYGYETVYGYAKTKSGCYVQAAAIMAGEEIVEVLYRYSNDALYVDLDRMISADGYVTKNGNDYVISVELINKLKALCTEDGDMFAIAIEGEKYFGEYSVEFQYMVSPYAVAPDADLGIFGSSNSKEDFWHDLFDKDHGEGGAQYRVVKNEDGSITLIFSNGYTISELYYNAVSLPVEDQLVKDQAMSNSTGLDIYKYVDTYTTYNSIGNYLYVNGKYYNYYAQTIYDILFYNGTNFISDWYISEMYYRFNTVGQGDLPTELPVYETYVRFRSLPNGYYYNGSYGYSTNNFGDIRLYTFYIDGEIYVATGAEVTGESLLTFEGYVPLNEYMASLKVVIEETNYSGTYTINYKGTQVTVNTITAYVYETDSAGNTVGGYLVSSRIPYITENGVRKYIRASIGYGSILTKGEEVTVTPPSRAERNEWVSSYTNGNFTFVSYSWYEENERTSYFVKLAGRMYRYDTEFTYWWSGSFVDERLNEYAFEDTSVDKEWIYMLEISDEYGNVEHRYFAEFIPSDLGFSTVGEEIYPEIPDDYSQTLLGYTADGYALYEISYYVEVEGEGSDYTAEAQSDGTVFLHKNGVGYLKVTENGTNYYVRARKVTQEDGSEEIYCFLKGAVIDADDLEDTTDFVTISDNKITFSAELLEAAKSSNRNEMYIRFWVNGWGDMHLNYYQLEALFEIAE